MYDDGLHGDGSAGDGQFGTALILESPQIQYYIYAENNNAGIFSPQRAEHEYYTLNASVPVINTGDLVINEFMALNDSWIEAPNGDYEDWVELYNASPNTLALNNLYLSDSYNNPLKFRFPDNLTIPSHDYLIIWADYDTTNPNGLHGGFKLSGGGERIILSYPGIIIDSISFGQQQPDISYARCPNGSGPFGLLTPTFLAANCNESSIENLTPETCTLYPNPASGSFIIKTVNQPINSLEIYNLTGQSIYSTTELNQYFLNVNVSSFQPGLYIIRINQNLVRKITIGGN